MNRVKIIVKILVVAIVAILIAQITLPTVSVVIKSGQALKYMSDNAVKTEHYINTAEEMWAFAEEVNNGNRYRNVTVYLTADIDLGCSAEKLWVPMAIFEGSFDGQDHTISGLYIKSELASVGLFAQNNGEIKNLKIANSYIETEKCESPTQRIGFVAGYNFLNSNISNCTVINSEINSVSEGQVYVGGISGYNAGVIGHCINGANIYTKVLTATGGIVGNNYENVSNSQNTGTITAGEKETGYNAVGLGGIAGANHKVINLCTNYGTLKSYSYTGGIAGTNFDTGAEIVNSCNLGKVEGDICGGIVGRNGSTSNIYCNGGTVKNSVNIGEIDATTEAGAICHTNKKEGKIEDCYYLESDLSGCANDKAEENTVITQKTETEMKSEEFVEELNKEGEFYEYQENSFPVLDLVAPNIEVTYDKTNKNKVIVQLKADEPIKEILGWTITDANKTLVKTYYINCTDKVTVEDYNNNRTIVNITIDSVEDIEITADNYYINSFEDLQILAQAVNHGCTMEGKNVYLMNNIQIPEDYIWDVIGTSVENPFMGRFYGNDKTISGIKIKDDIKYKGLFGYIKNAYIEKLTVDGEIAGESEYTGGIAAYSYNSKIRECTNNIKITEQYSSNATLLNEATVGGIVGYARDGSTITKCINNGEIVYVERVGSAGALCICGGIAGYASSSGISYSKNNANITTTEAWYVGGIVGNITYTNSYVTECSNIGNIASTTVPQGLGGIVGVVRVSDISNNYNLGKVEYTGTEEDISKIGGIVGRTENTIEINNCYNAGQVENAGIVGIISSTTGTIKNNYYLAGSAEKGYYSSGIESLEITQKTEQEMKNQDFVNLLNNKTSVWKYDEGNTNKGFPIIVAPLVSIDITSLPSKLDYKNGENFVANGMVVTLTYDDGTKEKTTNYTVIGGNDLTCMIDKVEIQSNDNKELKAQVNIEVDHNVVGATCTIAGKCNVEGCDHTEALGHSFTNYVSNNDATCTKDGTKTAKCDRCEVTKTVKDIGSKLKHDYKTVITEPTCIAKGFSTHTCSKCDYTYKNEYVNALGHSFTNYVSNNDATCTKDGTKTAKCDRCTETHTITDEGTMKPHNYVDKKCTVCGKDEPQITITSDKYEISETYITKIAPGTKLEDFMKNVTIENVTEVTMLNGENTAITSQDLVATGMKLVLKSESKTITLILVVAGDVTADGVADFKDIVAINRHRLNKKLLEGEYLMAGDVTGDNKADFKDIVKINRFRLNKITQLFSIFK